MNIKGRGLIKKRGNEGTSQFDGLSVSQAVNHVLDRIEALENCETMSHDRKLGREVATLRQMLKDMVRGQAWTDPDQPLP